MSRWAVVAAVALLLAGAVPAATWYAARPASVERQAQELATRLRCPACQGASVADSPSPMARDLRRQILADLRGGRSADEITAGFVQSYGEWVLLSPPRRGIGLAPWAVAFLASAGAAALWLVTALRWRRVAEEEP